MLLKLDRLAMGVDALLLLGLLALGLLGDRIPLPKGPDSLLILRRGPEPAQLSFPSPQEPPAPSPEPVVPARMTEAPEPAPAPKPGHLEWGKAQAALDRGKAHLGEARRAGDPQKKRRAYTEAKKAFEDALSGIEAYRVICPDPNPAVDTTVTDIKTLIFECHKSSPLELR
jgi:hypothetical protein